MAESVLVALGLFIIVIVGFLSFYSVGPTEVELVRKQFGKKQTGEAQADVIKAQGLAKAAGFRAQNDAIGQAGTLAVNVATVLSEKRMQIVPQILVVGGGGGSLDGLAATLTKLFAGQAGLLTPAAGDGETPASDMKPEA